MRSSIPALAKVGFAAALLQLVYGVAAVVDPYPDITDSGWEVLWLVINLGMIATIAAWVVRFDGGPVAVGGGVTAAAGHLLRAAISAWLVMDPEASADAPIVISIMLMFGGMATLGVTSLRSRRPAGPSAFAPLATVAAGILTASLYSTNKQWHFILLGLLWGAAWLWMATINLARVAGGSTQRQLVRRPM